MPGSFVHLDQNQEIPLDPFFAGPWGGIRRVTIEPGERLTVGGPDLEAACYVITGSGQLSAGTSEIPFAAGSAATVLKGSKATFSADNDVLEVVITTVFAKSR
jgi:hypothetical protein